MEATLSFIEPLNLQKLSLKNVVWVNFIIFLVLFWILC
jgi:hypothetical protein